MFSNPQPFGRPPASDYADWSRSGQAPDAPLRRGLLAL